MIALLGTWVKIVLHDPTLLGTWVTEVVFRAVAKDKLIIHFSRLQNSWGGILRIALRNRFGLMVFFMDGVILEYLIFELWADWCTKGIAMVTGLRGRYGGFWADWTWRDGLSKFEAEHGTMALIHCVQGSRAIFTRLLLTLLPNLVLDFANLLLNRLDMVKVFSVI